MWIYLVYQIFKILLQNDLGKAETSYIFVAHFYSKISIKKIKNIDKILPRLIALIFWRILLQFVLKLLILCGVFVDEKSNQK